MRYHYYNGDSFRYHPGIAVLVCISDTRKVINARLIYFPHNNTMELIWTVVPAIALTVLVVIGLRNWFSFTGDAPKNALVVEVTGKQFGWIFRYTGRDKIFGKRYYKLIDDAE